MNIKELAGLLNVSTATVSKALNNKSDISSHTRKKVLAAAESLGYRPNYSARYLRSGKADTVALLLPTSNGDNILTASFFMRIARGLQYTLKPSGIDPVIHITVDQENEILLLQKLVEQNRADAIILTDTLVEDKRISLLQDLQFPFVTMGQSQTLDGEFNWVDFDHNLMGKECVRYAVNKGACKIAVVTLGKESMHGCQFLNGCLEEMQLFGIPTNKAHIFYGDKTESSGISAIQYFMTQNEQPDFIIFINDFQLMGASRYISLSEQVTLTDASLICAIESSDYSSRIHPKACLFSIDHENIGRSLGQAVLGVISERSQVQKILLNLKVKCF